MSPSAAEWQQWSSEAQRNKTHQALTAETILRTNSLPPFMGFADNEKNVEYPQNFNRDRAVMFYYVVIYRRRLRPNISENRSSFPGCL